MKKECCLMMLGRHGYGFSIVAATVVHTGLDTPVKGVRNIVSITEDKINSYFI